MLAKQYMKRLYAGEHYLYKGSVGLHISQPLQTLPAEKTMSEKVQQAIQSITIKDFKSIADITLDLGKVNVLIGENGAGKSNILEAIGVLSAAASGRMDYARLKDRGVRLSAPEVFKAALKGRERKETFSLEAQFTEKLNYSLSVSPKRESGSDSLHYYHENISKNDKEIIHRSTDSMNVLDKKFEKPQDTDGILAMVFADGEAAKIRTKYAAISQILEKYAIYAPSTPILRGISNDESKVTPLGLYGGGLAYAILYLLVSLDDCHTNTFPVIVNTLTKLFPWLEKVGVKKPEQNFISHNVHTGEHVVSFEDNRIAREFKTLLAHDVSEGALYALFLLMLILHPGAPQFFAIDNMDAALNPRLSDALLSEVIKLIKEQDQKQMILTTHNPSMLNALDLFDDDIRLYVVERSEEDGSTIVKRIKPLDDMTREQWRELMQGNTLSSLWTSGALGGIPRISI